ncbi:prtp, partial [Symbiodinium sp. KB8]
LHEYRADGCLQPHDGPLQALAALERVEGSSANFDHCMSQLEFMRRELCNNFATHQPPVQIAAGLLQGLALDGRLGAPAALADALLGRGGDFRISRVQRCAAERRWRLGVRAALAQSGLAQALAAGELRLSLEPDFALTLDAPGAFVLRLQYDLRRWLVLDSSLSSQGLGATVSLPVDTEQAWRRQLQGVADEAASADSDVPAALATAAHFFCSHLWLQACCDEARAAHGQLREVSSTFWDRRGFASLRILPDWEPTCGGICAAPAASSTRASTDETQGPASGITLELHKDPDGGIRPSLPPEFASLAPLPVQPPSRLASLGGVGPCLDEVLRQAHAAVSAFTMRRLRVGLLQVVPSRGAPLLDESQVEDLPDGQSLRCLRRGCWVHVGLDASGRLALEAQGCTEPRRQKAAGGHEGFLLRMEALRFAALREAAGAAVAAEGWQSNVSDAPESGCVHFTCRSAEDRLDALEFDLGDSEISNVNLVVEGGACIHATGLDNFSFVQPGGESASAIIDLQKGLRQHLAQAQLLLAVSTLGREVIVTVAEHAKVLEASGYEAILGHVASPVPGTLEQGGELCFKRLDAVEATGKLAPTPFASPLRFQVADLNDLTTIANLVQQGFAEASVVDRRCAGVQTPAATAEVATKAMPELGLRSAPTTPKNAPPPVPVESDDDGASRRPQHKAPPAVENHTVARVRGGAYSSTGVLHTHPGLDGAGQGLPDEAVPNISTGSGGSSDACCPNGTYAFGSLAALAAGVNPFGAAISMSASASGLATPAQSTTGRRPPNMQEIKAALDVQSAAMAPAPPSTALMPSTTLTAPEPETTTGPQLIDPDLGIPAVATVEADTFQWWTHRRRQAHSDAAGGGAARAMRDAGGGAEVFFPSLDGGGSMGSAARPNRANNGWDFVLRLGGAVFYDHGVVPVVALAAFSTHLPGEVTAFIDNTAGQAALSNWYGKDPAMNGMLAAFWALAARQGTIVDFRRVPSKANVADAVSRDDFGRARREGWTRVHVPASPIKHILAKAVDDLPYAVDGAVWERPKRLVLVGQLAGKALASRARAWTFRALGRLCDAMCGAAARRRQASKVLTRARQKCIELRDKDASRTLCVSLLEKFKDDAGDDDLPLQHLRAAEQHLAAVERWLRGQGHEEGAENLRKELGVSEAQRRMSSSPEAIEFTQNFADIEGEVFVQALTGSVKVKSFRHPGKVFITNVRLCFFSCVLGVEVSCSVKWEEIASLRLVDTAHAQTYPVLVYFKDEIEFDGQGVKELDLRIFEFADLGALQKSATYFVGADLFGIYEEAEAKKSAPATASPAITRLERTSSLISPEAVLKELSMWELERRTNLFKSNWKAPYFPHDGVGKMKWVSFEDNSYSRHPFIPEGVDEQKISASETPPVEVVEFLGERRRCTWSTFPVEGETDELGWQYSTDFVLGNTGWLPYCASMSFVRRRCWKPSFYTDAEDDAKARDRAPTTILQNKDSKGAKFPIFEQVLGEISLEVLGQSLLTDDWRDPDCLMNFYWEEMGSVDLEISAWSDGSSFASVVKGKVRTIEMRSPVPPAPMCPKETRVQSTWHVVILEDKVLLESVSMSLDVPCGTNFNVIACDTFSVQDGKLKMVRTCGIEWLQNTWLKSLQWISMTAVHAMKMICLMLMLPTWACWLPLLAAVGMGGDAVSEALLGGRSAFVRFYAPWCGHSQAMQPAWQQLAKAYQSSGDIVISDVDCTAAENEELCRDQSIESYPTLKYFNVETGHAGRTYADARDYESLRRVAERVMMRCVPSTKQDCDARQKAYIERMRSAGAAAREQELRRRLLRLSGSEPSTARRAWLSNRIALLEGLGGQTVKEL